MIIIEGPDASGKSTLAKRFDLPYWHFNKESRYNDYLAPLANLELLDAVLDRSPISEYPYTKVMSREFAFTMKQWHNLILLTLIQNPLIILCVHKPTIAQYSKSQYLPYEKWDGCLALYKEFLNTHHIMHMEYDYAHPVVMPVLTKIAIAHRQQVDWWLPMWKDGFGAIGSRHPKVLLVAERMGPNNMNNLPFETGPTGHMLTNMLTDTGTPLGTFAVTNIVKSYRRDTRAPVWSDQDLLHIELENLQPSKVVFMGATAKYGIKVAIELGIPHVEIPHLGALHHKGITDMSGYHAQWRQIMGMVPTLTLGE